MCLRDSTFGVFDSGDPQLRSLFERSYVLYRYSIIIVHSSHDKINNYFVTCAVANLGLLSGRPAQRRKAFANQVSLKSRGIR